MIEASPAPEPAAQCLIEEPAIRHHVHGWVGRIDIDRAEGAVPELVNAIERDGTGIGAAKILDLLLHFPGGAADSEAEAGFAFLPVRQIECDLKRAARIEARSNFPGKARALERGGLCETAVPSEKFFSAPGQAPVRVSDVEENDPVREFGVVKIARQQCAGLEIHFGLHVEQGLVPQIPQNPFAITGDGQAARATGDVAQF